MIENSTIIKIELETMAQKILQQYMFTNNILEESISNGIKKAIDNYDFEGEIQSVIKKAIYDSIWNKFKISCLQEYISTKIEDISMELIDLRLQDLRKFIDEQKQLSKKENENA